MAGRAAKQLDVTPHLLQQRIHVGQQHIQLVINWQLALQLGLLGIIQREAVERGQRLAVLVTAKVLQAGVDHLPLHQRGKCHGAGADVDDTDRFVPLLQLRQTGEYRPPQGVCPDIHHLGGHVGFRQRGDPTIHALGAGRAQQHLLTLLIGDLAQDLEIQAHFIEGERDELFGLKLDLIFQLAFTQAGIHLNDLGDHVGAGDGSSHILAAARDEALETLERLADPLDILQLIIDQGAFGSGNLRHGFEVQLAGTAGDGHGLDGLTSKINACQWKQRTLVE